MVACCGVIGLVSPLGCDALGATYSTCTVRLFASRCPLRSSTVSIGVGLEMAAEAEAVRL
jgi:hypothetical protein